MSTDERTLVAHGRAIKPLPEEAGGSIYRLSLADDTTIKSVTLLPLEINTPSYDNFPDFASNGDIVYSSWGTPPGTRKVGEGDLYRARNTDAGWVTELFPGPVNTTASEAGPYVDSSERFVMYHHSRADPPVKDKVYLSERQSNEWGPGIRLPPPVNLDHSSQYGLRIDQSGRYLYWTSHHRGQGHLYRIPVSDIPALKPFFE